LDVDRCNCEITLYVAILCILFVIVSQSARHVPAGSSDAFRHSERWTEPNPVAARSSAWVCCRLFAVIAGSNSAGRRVEVSSTGRSLVHSPPTDCVWVIRCNSSPLHLQRVGRKWSKTKKELDRPTPIRMEKGLHPACGTAARTEDSRTHTVTVTVLAPL